MLTRNYRDLSKVLRLWPQRSQRYPPQLFKTCFGSLLTATTFVFALIFLLTLSIRFDSIAAQTSDGLKVKLPHGGALVGRHLATHKGRQIRAFMGVPYAQPPVGELRFKPPVPYGSWSGERLAIKDSDSCIQLNPYFRSKEVEGSEDCLYLNVYTPELLHTTNPLPVMVHIHGGGFQCGSASSSLYGPDYLLDHDVVLVIGNYRVGPIGFLSTETTDCPGNFGLKDQVEILRWVQQNIASFGGDPENVTLFGNSAGGASVTYHMLSNSSKGLFHRSITQSGTYYNPWSQPEHKGVPAKRARSVAQLVGCDIEANWPEILSCLREKNAEDIVATLYTFFEWDHDPMVPFQPVVEPPHEGAFLSVSPRDIRIPHGFTLPFIIGATSEEGLLKTATLLSIPGLLDDFKKNFDRVLPIVLQYDHHAPDVRAEITTKFKEFYLKEGHNYDKKKHQNLTDLMSDGWFVAGIDEFMRQRVEAEKSMKLPPFYVYLFEHRSPVSFAKLMFAESDDFHGVCHGDELSYFFPGFFASAANAVSTKADVELREALLQMWVNFATESKPTPTNSKLTQWNKVIDYPVNYARIGHKIPEEFKVLEMKSDLYVDRMNLWDELKPHISAERRKTNIKDEL